MSTRATENPLQNLTSEQKRALLRRQVQQRSGGPGLECAHALFESRAASTPDAVAARFRGQILTFRDLNERSNRLAHSLRALGVGPDVLVGLCVDRSLDMVVGLLAVLKAGGAYVPLDPNYPAGRLESMLADARVSVLLTHNQVISRLNELGETKPILFDACEAELRDRSAENPDGHARADNLAYVIFTSGSTGRPKGAMITHRGLVNYLRWASSTYDVASGLGAPVQSSISFDLTVTSLLVPLISGRRVDLLSEDEGIEALADALRSESGYSLVKITPAHLQILTRQLDPHAVAGRTRAFIIGGEQLPAESLAFWRQWAPDTLLVNEYGPTETVVGCSIYTVPRDGEPTVGPVPIGKPIAGAELYVLDSNLDLVPVGVTGELYIGGVGVARGYLNRPGLTAERFIPHPFSRRPGERLYRTGDLARWRPDGHLELLGRVDHQVKIRGYRIELGEVEASILACPRVHEAVAVAREFAPNDSRLVAYVVPRSGEDLDANELRDRLRAELPSYMVPSAFVVLSELPLTPNGKLDRAALPAPIFVADRGEVAPRTTWEVRIAVIWAAVLGLDRVGAEDDFFELGGHSLLATQMISRLRADWGVEVPLRTLFEASTVARLASRVEAVAQNEAGGTPSTLPIVPHPRENDPPLSYAQQALWFLDHLNPGQPTFNMTAAVRIRGPLATSALERAFLEMVRRHESLRTTFPVRNGQPVQAIAPALDLPLRFVDLIRLMESERESELVQLAVEEARSPFDLARGPLVRGVIASVGHSEHAIILVMHHIISDGWSMGVAARELTTLYEAFCQGQPSPLSDLPVHYADYTYWQRSILQGEGRDDLLAYWTRQLQGVAPLELPPDRPRPAVRSARGDLIAFTLSKDLARSLYDLSRREGTTLYMIVMAAFQTLLHRYSGQVNFAVGSPVANRTRAEIEGLIGYFVNMVTIRADLAGDPSFRGLLGRVRETVLGAFEHQALPLDQLIEAIQPARDPSRTPLFQVMLVLQNNPMPTAVPAGLSIQPLDTPGGTGTAKFDLSLGLVEVPEGLAASFEYDTDLFDAATIDRMIDHFRVLLEGIVAHPDQRLSALPILTEPERSLLLTQGHAVTLEPSPAGAIHERFEAQAALTPDRVAVVGGDFRLTYRELNARANQLAHRLRRLGLEPEGRVGLCVSRSPLGLIGVLGVLKAGGTYVPLDPENPRERLAFVIKDAGLSVLLTEQTRRDAWSGTVTTVLALDDFETADDHAPDTNPGVPVCPEQVAYVVYTSGSTGKPKGVMVRHAGLVNAYRGWEDAYQLRTRTSRHLQMAGFAFDVFAGDWTRALCSGGALVICPRETLLDPAALYDLLQCERIDAAEFVPAVLDALIAHLEPRGLKFDFMKLIAVGSDRWSAGSHERLRGLCDPDTRVVNSYGLTEVTIDSTYFEGSLMGQPAEASAPIGKPFPGTFICVLDRNFELVPVGVPGELYVGGPGLARGYLNQPGLTADRFIPNPIGGAPGDRLYRTGDLVRWHVEGTLEFLGRVDHQVKVRGFRVELGEIEEALSVHTGVEAVAVVARPDERGDTRLDGYVVPRLNVVLDLTDLRKFLQERVPRHMIPSTFTMLSELPRNSSGKVDRLALPSPEVVSSTIAVVPPRDEIEARLATLWQEVLGLATVGVTDSFFDLGGHSMLAIRLISRIEEEFGKRLPVSRLFVAATVEDVARLLREPEMRHSSSPLVPIQTRGTRPPFFCVHPANGLVLAFWNLARELGSEWPLHGLQAVGHLPGCEPDTDLTAMAARYVTALREFQPNGPYRLGGWSLGGAVAFEMACQLRAWGEVISSLILFDTPAPTPFARQAIVEAADRYHALAGLHGSSSEQILREQLSEESRWPEFIRDLAAAFSVDEQTAVQQFRRISPAERVASLLPALGLDQIVSREAGPDFILNVWRVRRANLLASAKYRPGSYDGRITLLRPRPSAIRGRLDASLGWDKLTTGGVTIREIPGDHDTMFTPPHVGGVASVLRSELERTP